MIVYNTFEDITNKLDLNQETSFYYSQYYIFLYSTLRLSVLFNSGKWRCPP